MLNEMLLFPAVAIFISMNLLFVIAQVLKNNSIVDIAWGVGFILVAIVSIAATGNQSAESMVMLSLIAAWGLRLAIYIFFRNKNKGEDYRYKQWREAWGKHAVWRAYLQVFMLQGFLMWVVALPVMLTIASGNDKIGLIEVFGIAIWLLGFFFEAVGDYQMSRFKKNPANKGKIMKYGLWHYTRHPNYFGEVVMWWGVFLIAANNIYPLLSLISPVLLTFLLLRISGVTMLEKKYESNPEYQEYIKNTSAFIPRKP